MTFNSKAVLLAVLTAGVLMTAAGAGFVWWQQRLVAQAKEAVRTEPAPELSSVGVLQEVAPAVLPAESAAWERFRLSQLACAVSEPVTTVAFVGDIMLSRSVGRDLKKSRDYDKPFRAMTTWLAAADLTVGNLETSITPGREVKDGEMMFRADAEVAPALARAGFDVVSLANNHTPNFGVKGLADTFSALKGAGVRYVGAGRDAFEAYQPAYLKANGLTFAFIAQNDRDVVPKSYSATEKSTGTALLDEERLKTSIGEARAVADVVVFLLHSGREYTAVPNGSQTKFARAAIDAGADLVVGHHAHVVQAMEMYRGKPIIYGLGNFVFDQSWSRDTQEGLAVRVAWRGRQLERVEFEPVNLHKSYPDFATEETSRRVLARLNYSLGTEQLWRWFDLENRIKPEERRVLVERSGDAPCRRDRQQAVGGLRLTLASGGLTVARGGETVWQSPPEIWVSDFAPATAAGVDYVAVSYWQASAGGGRSRLGLLTERQGRLTWHPGESDLHAPICDLAVADLDAGDRPEAIALLGSYDGQADGACLASEATVFRSEEGGGWRELTVLARGAFSGLSVTMRQGRAAIQLHAMP